MAGLPFIGWRQSAIRCAEFFRQYPEAFAYTLFLVVARVCMECPSDGLLRLSDYMKAYLFEPKERDRQACRELRENWYFLRSAIQSVLAQMHPPKGALPYRIMVEYQRRWQCQTQADILMNRANRL